MWKIENNFFSLKLKFIFRKSTGVENAENVDSEINIVSVLCIREAI